MWGLLGVVVGGGLGSGARYGVALAMRAVFGAAFPVGTLVANIVGSFLLGVLARSALDVRGVSAPVRLALTTGFCGGFTTYSTFNLETLSFFEHGRYAAGALYLGLTVVLCAGAGLLGFFVARAV